MTTAKNGNSGLRLAIDYAPLLVFVAITFFAPDAPLMKLVAGVTHGLDGMERMKAIVIARVLVATTAFMVATVIAMVISQIKLKSISPMLWISGALVVVFGGLTVYFHDPSFIKMKPTFVYLLFSGTLAFGLLTGRPLLEQLLGTAYPGLDADGWRKVTRNWAIFFVFMAMLNEAVWRATAPNPGDPITFWAGFKLWGAIPLTMLFAFANVPMMMKHGLMAEGDEKADAAIRELPPE
ncbi:inner membrane-spanning protein YciB [Sphingomonas bacterium]|uniref:inner membrane-spanning protein YciB n=1 Tax=Sphingomonas bacterium TaxID=1895847 RepID=UPI002631C04E|nr:inner membrane-spanning protein YciB [Sphingomonas bacterium]MDB5678077.1 septation protein [Sphingomonas bacterium]